MGRYVPKDIRLGDYVLLSFKDWDPKPWYGRDGTEYLFYEDRQIIAVLETKDTVPVRPRDGHVIVRPTWDRAGVVEHGSIYKVQRLFDDRPEPPVKGVVVRSADDVAGLDGLTVLIPKSGGHELGVRDTVYYSLKANDIMGTFEDGVTEDPARPNSRRRKTTSRSR